MEAVLDILLQYERGAQADATSRGPGWMKRMSVLAAEEGPAAEEHGELDGRDLATRLA